MRARLGARAATIGGIAAAIVVATGAAAWAHHPEITATTDCGGVVHFTSTAWTTTSTAARTNPTIGISYSTDGGTAFTSLPQLAAYHFGADNGYTFSDTFTLARPLPATVIVRATALGNWANGASGGAYRQTSALTVAGCPAAPSATISDVDCSSGDVLVRLSNDGDLPATFTLAGPDGAAPVVVDGHDSVTRGEPVAEDGDVTVTVTADGMTPVTRTVHRDCVQPAPAAVLTSDCDGIHVTLTNTGSQDAVFTVTRSGGSSEDVTVAPGASATRTYPVAEGATVTVTVTSPGMAEATETFTCHCATDLPTPPAGNGPGDHGGVTSPPTTSGGTQSGGTTTGGTPAPTHQSGGVTSSGTSVLGVTVHRSDPATPTTPAVRASGATNASTLPFTGGNTGDLLTAGLVSLVLGAALTRAGRRQGDAC